MITFNGRPHPRHQIQIIMEIMNGVEMIAENLPTLVEMAQIGAGIVAAGIAGALRIQRGLVVPVAGIFDGNFAGRGEQRTVAGIAGGHHAVKHIDTPIDTLHQIFRGAHTHKIARIFHRQLGDHRLGHLLHLSLVFTDTQAAQGIAVKADIDQRMGMFPTQIGIHPALHNPEKELIGPTLRLPAAPGPASGEIRRLDRLVPGGRIRNTGIKAHHDIRAQGLLYLNRLLRPEKELGTVQVRTKGRALLGDLGQLLQAEDLESAAIGEDGPIPVHKLVQAAETPDQLMAGPDIEMIGITEDNLGIHLGQVFRGDGLHRAQSAHRHKYRGLKGSMFGGHLAPTGGTAGGVTMKGKRGVIWHGKKAGKMTWIVNDFK